MSFTQDFINSTTPQKSQTNTGLLLDKIENQVGRNYLSSLGVKPTAPFKPGEQGQFRDILKTGETFAPVGVGLVKPEIKIPKEEPKQESTSILQSFKNAIESRMLKSQNQFRREVIGEDISLEEEKKRKQEGLMTFEQKLKATSDAYGGITPVIVKDLFKASQQAIQAIKEDDSTALKKAGKLWKGASKGISQTVWEVGTGFNILGAEGLSAMGIIPKEKKDFYVDALRKNNITAEELLKRENGYEQLGSLIGDLSLLGAGAMKSEAFMAQKLFGREAVTLGERSLAALASDSTVFTGLSVLQNVGRENPSLQGLAQETIANILMGQAGEVLGKGIGKGGELLQESLAKAGKLKEVQDAIQKANTMKKNLGEFVEKHRVAHGFVDFGFGERRVTAQRPFNTKPSPKAYKNLDSRPLEKTALQTSIQKAKSEGKSFEEWVGTNATPKTVKVFIKSKFSDVGSMVDIPVIRREDNLTLYQGGATDGRQFWTPNKNYESQFGEVTEKTGSFYKVENGNRITDVYIEALTPSQIRAEWDLVHQRGLPKEPQFSRGREMDAGDINEMARAKVEDMGGEGKTLNQKGVEARAEKSLNQKIRYEGKIITKKEFVDKNIDRGSVPKEVSKKDTSRIESLEKQIKMLEYDGMGNINAEKINKIREEIKTLPEKKTYRIVDKDGSFFDLSKAEYNYAISRHTKSEPSKPSPQKVEDFTLTEGNGVVQLKEAVPKEQVKQEVVQQEPKEISSYKKKKQEEDIAMQEKKQEAIKKDISSKIEKEGVKVKDVPKEEFEARRKEREDALKEQKKIKDIAISEARVRANKDLPEDAKLMVEYGIKHNNETAEASLELVKRNKNEAYDILMGNTDAGEYLVSAIGSTMMKLAKQEGNIKLLKEITERLYSRLTKAGQEIQYAKSLYKENPEYEFMQKLLNARAKEFNLGDPVSTLQKKTNLEARADDVAKEIEKLKKLKQEIWEDTLDFLTCK